MKSIPWSAEGEKRIRWIIACYWILFWICVTSSIYIICKDLGVISGFAQGTASCIYAIGLFRERNRLQAMLLNKPRNTENLTQWIRLRPWELDICPKCGAALRMTGANWCPNSIDPGGGRFSVVCSCGTGYYRLYELKAG